MNIGVMREKIMQIPNMTVNFPSAWFLTMEPSIYCHIIMVTFVICKSSVLLLVPQSHGQVPEFDKFCNIMKILVAECNNECLWYYRDFGCWLTQIFTYGAAIWASIRSSSSKIATTIISFQHASEEAYQPLCPDIFCEIAATSLEILIQP